MGTGPAFQAITTATTREDTMTTTAIAEPSEAHSAARPISDLLAVEVNDVTKVFATRPGLFSRKKVAKRIVAVDHITLSVHKGEIFGVLGPNGTGKSTLIRLMSTLLLPDTGSVRIFGLDVEKDEAQVKRLINRVSVEASFFKKLSPMENLMYGARLYSVPPATARKRIIEILASLGLEDRSIWSPMEDMSRGMQQKVAIARAFLTSPILLLLDEPTTGLDPIGARQMKDAILNVRDQGKTVLLCSHLLADVQAICDRVAILSEGKLVKFGTVQELVGPSQSFEIFAAGLGAEANSDDRAKKYGLRVENGASHFTAQSSEQLDEILTFIRDHGGRTTDVKGHSETLEDVFVRSVRSDGR